MSSENNNENVSERAEALLNKGKAMTQEEIFELKGFSSNKLYANRIAALMSEIGNKTPENMGNKTSENTEKGLERFEITTDGMGGWDLAVGDKSKLSAKQREWCENTARLAASKGLNGNVSYGSKLGADSKAAANEKKYSISYKNGKPTDVKVLGSDGKYHEPTLEELGKVLEAAGKSKKRGAAINRGYGLDQMIDFYKQMARGVAQNVTDLAKTPFQMARDVAKFGKMIAQGRFREATGKASERVAENLKAMIGLGTENESKLYGITKYTRRNIADPVRSIISDVKQMGRDIKGLFGRLSGRTGMQPVKSVAQIRGKERGR